MRLPAYIIGKIDDLALWMTKGQDPFKIGGERNPYLCRWSIIPANRWLSIYLHQFLRSDDDRALHDHRGHNLSILLYGSYIEHTIAAGGVHRKTRREQGDVVFRRASSAHRIEIDRGPCWTLFVTGPTLRQWGFHCPNGWVHWKDFVNPNRIGEAGPGCGGS